MPPFRKTQNNRGEVLSALDMVALEECDAETDMLLRYNGRQSTTRIGMWRIVSRGRSNSHGEEDPRDGQSG